MRKLILTVVLTMAIPSASAAAPMCIPGSLDRYIALGAAGCSIGDALFFDFASPPLFDRGTPIDPANVNVVPLHVPFSGGSAETFDYEIRIPDDHPTGTFWYHPHKHGARLPLPRLQLQQFIGNTLSITLSTVTDGGVVAVEHKCLGGSFDLTGPTGCTGTPAVLTVFDIGSDADLFAQMDFGGVGLISVFNHIVIDSGLIGSGAVLTVRNQFVVSEVPEPSALLLMATGLLGMLVRRRRHHRQS